MQRVRHVERGSACGGCGRERDPVAKQAPPLTRAKSAFKKTNTKARQVGGLRPEARTVSHSEFGSGSLNGAGIFSWGAARLL